MSQIGVGLGCFGTRRSEHVCELMETEIGGICIHLPRHIDSRKSTGSKL
jgi:hypothetical protein